MRTALKLLAALAALGLLAGATVVGFGLYNTSARQGHWPGVGAVMHTTFKQSVRLRAPGEEAVPDDLAAPDRIALGALHYQSACAFCHAVPGIPRSATALSLNPQPPHISEAVQAWEPRHMFWIVREGVKMTGMPGWPADGHDDEIWSVVAYLEAVKGMTPEDQRALTGARLGRSGCTACHGEGGRSTNSFVPRLDILTSDEIVAALSHYSAGRRPSGMMQEVVSRLDDEDIADLGREFGAAERPSASLPPGSDEPGMELATRGTASVPACIACHGPGRQSGAAPAPAIAGQSRDYIAIQLRLWRDGKRDGGPRAELMRKSARALTDGDIEALADWFSSLDQVSAN
ncbi:c-type cytochrome [Vannielia litorea]|uniref:Cytochrome c553 n=1 Tax=Vannielia litorea TaxID=1217970 RepID=A0A1N6FYY4_9RHOB|nr:c-type cytochrome [Vannielia litorea]SIO00411.1 Cytochrome c553 [Vannielia litorea]